MKTFSEKLRLIADFFEQHPELETPCLPTVTWAPTKDQALAVARLPGAQKVYNDAYLKILVLIGDDVELEFFTDRDRVCTAKRVEKVLQPARAEQWIDKVIEWECHPLLAPDVADKAITASPAEGITGDIL